MTWIEITFWVIAILMPTFFVVLAIITDESDIIALGLMLLGLYLVVGGFIGVVNSDYAEMKITSQFETTPVHVNLSSTGLNVITDEYEHYNFTDYSDVDKWKNGGKFYKTYYYGKCNFGMDRSKFELIIK